LKRYQELIKEGDRFLSVKEPDYQKAMNSYSAAMTACKDKMPEVQQKILMLFDKINQLKKRAELSEKNVSIAKSKTDSALIIAKASEKKALFNKAKADSTLQIAESQRRLADIDKQNALDARNMADSALMVTKKIIDQLYFYKDRYALACKRIPVIFTFTGKTYTHYRLLYGFIDKQGNSVIRCKYKIASPIDYQTGFAKVKREPRWTNYTYLIDTTANEEYILCEDLSLLNNKTTALRLKEKGLHEIPEKVFEYKQLKILLLSQNLLNRVPPEISSLSNNLFFLDISFNNIGELDREIGTLKNLTTLNIEGNQLISIPDEIGNLQNLKILQLSNNELSSLPEKIKNLNSLKELDLQGNIFSTTEKIKVAEWLPNCKIAW
ncbi:MAG: WG repeat-containing protein, partial [Mariniphaga sp.]